jgi:hypothetical protein
VVTDDKRCGYVYRRVVWRVIVCHLGVFFQWAKANRRISKKSYEERH